MCWIGGNDLKGAEHGDPDDPGPIARVLMERDFERVVLLANYPKKRVSRYTEWLRGYTSAHIEVHPVSLPSPTHFGAIYEAAVRVLDKSLSDGGAALSFHLSPGTPAMAAVWIILGKTRFPAELIESSRELGVRTVPVPFDISAEFLPDLLRGPDARLGELSQARPPEAPEFEDIKHRSRIMVELIALARRAALRSVPVLIQGESGTGKELLARAIHQASPRRDRRFVPVNCGALPENLVDSQLFGHVKGAFTGADRDHDGFFAQADGGTLFLDEVGELPLASQVKLLRTLQEGKIVPVGASKEHKIDVRIIAATNRTLLAEVASSRFREDLFYRLAVAVLEVPPLRARRGDLGLLIDHLLELINEHMADEIGYKPKALTPSARNALLQHTWPGNVRELHNTLQRAALWSEGTRIGVNDIRQVILAPPQPTQDGILGRPLGNGLSLQRIIGEVASHYLHRALAEAGGNRTRAAKLVGLSSYQTFDNWLKRYDSVESDSQ